MPTIFKFAQKGKPKERTASIKRRKKRDNAEVSLKFFEPFSLKISFLFLKGTSGSNHVLVYPCKIDH